MPIVFAGRVAAVIVYSSPVGDIVHTVATVRHEILVAGAIALALALIASFLVARALAQRVKRLELAAKQVAAGEFGPPIPVDSSDELGALAVAFNDMQSQLEQLELTRKKFIATASHELRTPVFSLGGFVELLEDDDLDAETRRRFLDQVRDQVQRLGKLSVNLLDLSRLESGSLGAAARGGRPRGADAVGLRGVRADAAPARRALGAAASRAPDRGPVRSGARRPDHAHPDRQRAHPHAAGHADRRHRRPRRRADPARGPR